MFVELSAASGLLYLYNRFFLNNNYYKYKRLVKDLALNNASFSNSNNISIKFVHFQDSDYTKKLIVNINKVLGFEELQKKKDYLVSYFECKDIIFTKLENTNIQLDLIYSNKPIGNYSCVEQKDCEVLVGFDAENNPVLVNMNDFPHMVIGGQTGTGKSRFLMQLLTNMINKCKDIELYLFQIRKSDLILFKNCKQTKAIVRTLEDARDTLKYLNDIAIKRDNTIERLIHKNILNIEDYNRYSKFNKMKYIYLVLDEFSFFNVDGADDKYTKILKREILAYIKHLAVAARSSGIFIITSLQKPTNNSLPSDIKSQFATRVSFRMGDDAESIVVLGNANATKLKGRECIVRTNKEQICKVSNIDMKIINDFIKNSIEINKKYIDIKNHINKDTNTNTQKCNNDGIINEDVLKDAFE